MTKNKHNLVLAFTLVILGVASVATAEAKTYRSYSGGSESARPKVIRSVEDAKLYKDEDPAKDMRARPIYEDLNEDESLGKSKEIKKKVYASRSGSSMARPKIIVQK